MLPATVFRALVPCCPSGLSSSSSTERKTPELALGALRRRHAVRPSRRRAVRISAEAAGTAAPSSPTTGEEQAAAAAAAQDRLSDLREVRVLYMGEGETVNFYPRAASGASSANSVFPSTFYLPTPPLTNILFLTVCATAGDCSK